MNHYLKRYDVYLDHYKVDLNLSSFKESGAKTCGGLKQDKENKTRCGERNSTGKCSSELTTLYLCQNIHDNTEHVSPTSKFSSEINMSVQASTMGLLDTPIESETDIHFDSCDKKVVLNIHSSVISDQDVDLKRYSLSSCECDMCLTTASGKSSELSLNVPSRCNSESGIILLPPLESSNRRSSVSASQENVTYNTHVDRISPDILVDSKGAGTKMDTMDIFSSSLHHVHTCPSDYMINSFSSLNYMTQSTDSILDESVEENVSSFINTNNTTLSNSCGQCICTGRSRPDSVFGAPCTCPKISEQHHSVYNSVMSNPPSPTKTKPPISPTVKSSSASSFLFSMNSLRRRKKSRKKSSKVTPTAPIQAVVAPKLLDQTSVLLDNCNSDSELNLRSFSSVDCDIRAKVPQFDESTDARLGRLEKEFSQVMRVEDGGGLGHDWYYHCQTLPKNNPKSKHLSIGRKKFNMDPKKGIEYLIEHGFLQNTPKDIASFLHKGEGLNKTAIGDYLGEKNDFNIDVLKEFVNLHEFSDMILVQALRMFLWSFRLPGEAQKIDRMMECFAQRYCDSNPDVFTSTDTCYVLSFAIIMLNTSLHNPSVKDKPNVDRFISMNRGIADGADLPVDLLTSIYESIKKEPFKFPEDDGNDLMHTFFNPDKEGWLWKQGGRYKNWKRRWFILNDNCLYYFEFTADKEPKGIIPLENIQVKDVQDAKKPHCFELSSVTNEVIKACKTDSEGKVVEGKHHVYRMSASKPEEKDEWIKCIKASISENPFYDMLAARRKKAQQNSSKNRNVKK